MKWAFVITGAVLLLAGAVTGIVGLLRRSRGERLWLVATILVSTGLLGLVSGWLMSEPNPNRGEALKTGGLAAGAVVALYALWLNDRKRRTDEQRHDVERLRQDLESERTQYDRERAADERFARAVELLGNPAGQVRVGALHVLAGVARSRPDYTQTVLDVCCAYLRWPFDRSGAVDLGEQQVRLTAQRVIADLLPRTADETPQTPHYDLNLTGADLEYFDISERVVGELTLRYAHLHESNSLWSCHVHGDAWFTAATSHGILHADDVVFERKAWFSGFTAGSRVRLARVRYLGPTKFDGARFPGAPGIGEDSPG
ncbi:hypothetical protein [Actinokineospora sp. PR83]|uniref:hypothetical protein n=1 Tax=Actinokineospora sp. PR83 TaxID=2884908 RepID=UPI0027E1CA22|nr:hypothetical protein [Actinokineospora sp. PR83]